VWFGAQVACEEAVVTAPAQEALPKEEPVDEITELTEIVEEVDSYMEPKPEDVMRTVGLSKEALENASIVIIQDDGEVVKMADVKAEEKAVAQEQEHKDVVEVVSAEEPTNATVIPAPVSTETPEEDVVPVEVRETENAQVETEDLKPARIQKQKRNSREEEKKDDGRRNSLRKGERGRAEEHAKEEEVPFEQDSFLDANEESHQTLDKIHLLVEEEARKNEAKDDFDNISEERESFEETFTKEEVESVILEKRDEGAEKARKEGTRRDAGKGSRPRRNSRKEKSPDLAESSTEAFEEIAEKKDRSRKERKTSSSQESDKSDGRRSASLRRDDRRKDEDSKAEDYQDKSKIADLSEAVDDTSR